MLDLYSEPYDAERPVVCFDETSTQLLADVREPLLAQPGRPRREDYEYRREGTRNLFLTCEPRAGWRHVAITKQRTMRDFAHQMRWLVDEAYPHVPVIRVVLDKLQVLIEFGGSDNEENIRPAFQNCLDAYCHDHRERLALIPELKTSPSNKPDGTVKDSLLKDSQ